jgi:hypothetical protein
VSYNHEAERELVEQTFSAEWGEPSAAVHIGRFQPTFTVPGRAVDGSSATAHPIRQFLGRVLHGAVVIVDAVLDMVANTTVMSVDKARSGRVQGTENSEAVRFADTVRGEFWLVISASRVAAAQTGSARQVAVVWSGVGAARPRLDPDVVALRWPDGSSVFLSPEPAERQRLASV